MTRQQMLAQEGAREAYKGYSDDAVTARNGYMRGYREGYEQAEKDTIERACKWLFSHLPILVDYYDEDIHTNADRSEFIKLFRMQLEEE